MAWELKVDTPQRLCWNNHSGRSITQGRKRRTDRAREAARERRVMRGNRKAPVNKGQLSVVNGNMHDIDHNDCAVRSGYRNIVRDTLMEMTTSSAFQWTL